MNRRSMLLILLVVCTVALRANGRPVSKELVAADEAWDRGDYVTALQSYMKLLSAPGGDAFLEPIALQTGELYRTRELTRDGRAPRFSPDGRYLAFETGADLSRCTHILKNDAALTLVADLSGIAASFSRKSAAVAYLRLGDDPELARATAALDHAAASAPNRNQLIQAVAWLQQKNSRLVLRDLETQQETELATPSLVKTALAFAAGTRRLPDGSGAHGHQG